MAHQGGCLCRKIRFNIETEPTSARLCWCRDCQYWAAGMATFNVLFPDNRLTVTGDVQWFESIAASGNKMRRGFCASCGTHLFSTADPLPADGQIRVRAGALDNPDILPPQAIIWTQSAPKWVKHDPTLPQYPQQPTAPPQTVREDQA